MPGARTAPVAVPVITGRQLLTKSYRAANVLGDASPMLLKTAHEVKL